jgi:LysM repeat protein
MSDHSQPHATDPTRSTWQASLPADPTISLVPLNIRGAAVRSCPACDAPVGVGATQCAECGEPLVRAPKQIRCAHCATLAISSLTVCPGCGRELREAPPHLLRYGAPLLAASVLLLLMGLVWTRLSPLNWARNNLARGVTLVEGIGASLEPQMVIVMTPIVLTPVAAYAVDAAATPFAPVGNAQAIALAAPGSVLTDSVAGDVVALPTPTVESPVGVGGPSSAQTAAAYMVTPVVENLPVTPATPIPPTATALPTATSLPPTATATALPTDPAPTENAANPESNNRAGILGAIDPTPVSSGRTPTATWTPLAPEASIAQAAGSAQEATTISSPALTLPVATPTPVVYQVRAGDTLVSIAARYAVTVDSLMAANAISARDAYVIQPGQLLVVPQATPTPGAVSLPAFRLEAPALSTPDEGAVLGCADENILRWERVQLVKDSDRYLLHLGFVSGPPTNHQDGSQETITWVLAQMRPVTETSWQMDPSLCDLAPAAYGNQWRWWVEVVEENGGAQVAVSPPSVVRRLVWK